MLLPGLLVLVLVLDCCASELSLLLDSILQKVLWDSPPVLVCCQTVAQNGLKDVSICSNHDIGLVLERSSSGLLEPGASCSAFFTVS